MMLCFFSYASTSLEAFFKSSLRAVDEDVAGVALDAALQQGVHSHTVPMYSYVSIAVVYIYPPPQPAMELRVSRYTCRCVVRASNHVNPAPHPNVLINFDLGAIVKVDSILMWCDSIQRSYTARLLIA